MKHSIPQAPGHFSYIQAIVDEDEQGKFVLTGSQNFLLLDKVNQSLAGRTRILHLLLPLRMKELRTAGHLSPDSTAYIWRGGYPCARMPHIDPQKRTLDYNIYRPM